MVLESQKEDMFLGYIGRCQTSMMKFIAKINVKYLVLRKKSPLQMFSRILNIPVLFLTLVNLRKMY